MKSLVFWKWILGVSLTVTTIAGLRGDSFISPLAQPVAVESDGDEAAEPPQTDLNSEQAAPDIADAPATPVPAEKSLPANVKLSDPAAEVAKLANSGVEESVLLSYVKNSTNTFNLGADDIIYFKDLGISEAVVTAMIERDRVLRTSTPAHSEDTSALAVSQSPPAEQAPAPVYQAPAPTPDANATPTVAEAP